MSLLRTGLATAESSIQAIYSLLPQNSPGVCDVMPALISSRRSTLTWWRRPIVLLALVALVHGSAPLILMGSRWGFGIDETVYLSQINAHVPASLFSAPRARGTTLVAAPVTLLTSSVSAVRIWLAMLSAACLFLAYRPWLRARPGYVAPIAAALFSTIWSAAYYAFGAMPNEWVAFALVAASGYTLLFLRQGRHRQLIWIGSAMAITALFRPSDAGFAALGLIVAGVLIESPVRLRVYAVSAVVLGVVLGTAEWVIEAWIRFGGITARIHGAQADQGGGGLRFSGLAQARTLAGPLLCRGNCTAHASIVFWFWWFAGGALIVIALVFARRRLRRGDELLPFVVGLATAAQYILTVSYSAPRFLIPTYALLALPCAAGLAGLRRRVPAGRPRVLLASALAFSLAVHVAIQADVIVRHLMPPIARYDYKVSADAASLHALGVRGPCIVLGQPTWNAALAYSARCTNEPTSGPAVLRAITAGSRVVWLGPGPPPTKYGTHTRRVSLPGSVPGRTFVAYLILGRAAQQPPG